MLPWSACPNALGGSFSERKLLDDDFVSESDTVPAPLRGREAARQSMQMHMKAFPELF